MVKSIAALQGVPEKTFKWRKIYFVHLYGTPCITLMVAVVAAVGSVLTVVVVDTGSVFTAPAGEAVTNTWALGTAADWLPDKTNVVLTLMSSQIQYSPEKKWHKKDDQIMF